VANIPGNGIIIESELIKVNELVQKILEKFYALMKPNFATN
jgi:hypothetical protein